MRILKTAAAMSVICALAVAGMMLPREASAGFGVSPPLIREEHLAPGVSLTRTIYLVQGDPRESLFVEVAVESDQIKDWLSFSPGVSFTIPAGVQQFPFEVTIAVPKDANLGVYKAFVRVNTAPTAAEGATSVAVSVGGRIDVDVTVGDEVFVSYGVKELQILDTKERADLLVEARVENKGNVPAVFDSATFELFDKFNSVRLGFATAGKDQFPQVPPFSEKRITLRFPAGIYLAPGEYWGHVRVFNADGEMIREAQNVFNVRERTIIDVLRIPLIVLGAVAVCVALALFVVKVRRRMTMRRAQ